MSNKKIDELNEIRNYIGEVNKEIIQNDSRNIIAYCRVSDLKQVDNYSTQTQFNNAKRYTENNGFKIVKKFEVLGESSKKGSKRPSIEELLEFIKTTNHKIHSIVVFHSNRFTRDGSFGADFLDKIIKKGIGFTDLNSPNDIFNPEGRLRQINAFYGAEQDNLTRKKFINSTIIEKLKDGYTMRRPSFGYSMTYIGKGKDKKQKIVINKDGKKLKQAFKLKLDYGYSNVIISEKLQALGINMSPKRVGRVFKNVYYCGLVKDKRLIDSGGVIKGRHPQMITLEEYRIINNINGAKKRSIRKTDVEELPLRKHLKCSCCNKKLTGYKASRKTNLFYYKCRTKGCKVNVRNLKLHDLYQELINDISFNSKYILQLTNILKTVFKDINKSNNRVKKEITKTIGEVKNERFNAIKNMNSHLDKVDLFTELIDDCDNRLEELNTQLNDIKINIDSSNENIYDALQVVSDLPNIWNQSDLITKIKLQDLIFPNGVSYNKRSNILSYKNINPIFNVLKGFKDFMDSDSDLNDTSKINQKKNEILDKSRTDFFIKNISISITKSSDWDDLDVGDYQDKIPLVVLLSDRSNNFANKLVDSMAELVRFCNLISLNC